MSTMKTLIIRPADVSLNPLGAGSSVADARVSVVYDRDVWVGGQPVPRVPLISTSIPTAGLRVPVLASDDPSITEGAGFVIKVVVETAPRTGEHNDMGTSLARTIQVVTADPDEIPLGSKPNLTPVADPTQYADVMSAIKAAAETKAAAARVEASAAAAKQSAQAAEQASSQAVTLAQNANAGTDQGVAGLIGQAGSQTQGALDSVYARTKGRPISAYDYGVRPDVADITKPLNDLIAANPGATITLAPGSYAASADNGGVTSYDRGIKLNRPDVTLDLRGATINVIPNGAGNYQLITATAPDCRILGGRLVGDVTKHKATDGEWGHGIVATTGGDRLLVDGTFVTQMWGDGIFLDGAAADVCLRSVIADGNRRQGCSITNNVRPRIEGGAYINTGVYGFTAPGAGIDIEPDPNMGHKVIDFVLVKTLVAGNTGPGLQVCAVTGATTTGSADVRSSSNKGHGVLTDTMGVPDLYSVTIQADSRGNGGSGFVSNVSGTRFKACLSTANAERGWVINANVVLMTPLAESNGMSGYYIDAGASGSLITGLAAASNCRSANDTYPDVDIWAPNVTISNGVSVAPSTGSRASYGWVVRPGAKGARLSGCDASGSYTQGKYLSLAGDTYASPTPGGAA